MSNEVFPLRISRLPTNWRPGVRGNSTDADSLNKLCAEINRMAKIKPDGTIFCSSKYALAMLWIDLTQRSCVVVENGKPVNFYGWPVVIVSPREGDDYLRIAQ